MKRADKKQQVAQTLINEMFKIAGHNVTFEDIKGRQDNWYQQWTITVEQNDRWVEWGKSYIKKELRLPKKLAEREMQWFALGYGLKLADFDKYLSQ